jgi:hypothetical protein
LSSASLPGREAQRADRQGAELVEVEHDRHGEAEVEAGDRVGRDRPSGAPIRSVSGALRRRAASSASRPRGRGDTPASRVRRRGAAQETVTWLANAFVAPRGVADDGEGAAQPHVGGGGADHDLDGAGLDHEAHVRS